MMLICAFILPQVADSANKGDFKHLNLEVGAQFLICGNKLFSQAQRWASFVNLLLLLFPIISYQFLRNK